MSRQDQEKLRDRKLRRSLLNVLYAARDRSPTGYVSLEFMKETANYGREFLQRIDGDNHAIQLARDLVAMGLIEERPGVTIRAGDRLRPNHLQYRITAKGTDLLLENIPPIKAIEDEREVFE